jgi:hypothetical protein
VKSRNLNSELGTEGKGQKKKRSEGPSMWHEGASCWHVKEMLYTFAGDLQAKGLLGVHLGPPNLALINSHHPHPMASSCMRVCYCRHLRLKPLFSSPLPTPPKRAFFSFSPNLCCSQTGYHFIFFLFPNFISNIPRQSQTDFARLVTVFQETLKTGASRHKCGDTLPNHLLRWERKTPSFPL